MRFIGVFGTVLLVTSTSFGCALHVTGSEVRIDDLTKRISELEAKTDAHERNWQRTSEWSSAIGQRVEKLEQKGEIADEAKLKETE